MGECGRRSIYEGDRQSVRDDAEYLRRKKRRKRGRTEEDKRVDRKRERGGKE